ncbi:MAG: hypothetical protein ACKOEW_05780, partial [Methylocystis sp.]
ISHGHYTWALQPQADWAFQSSEATGFLRPRDPSRGLYRSDRLSGSHVSSLLHRSLLLPRLSLLVNALAKAFLRHNYFNVASVAVSIGS